jgi:hypothetical protein
MTSFLPLLREFKAKQDQFQAFLVQRNKKMRELRSTEDGPGRDEFRGRPMFGRGFMMDGMFPM